MLAYHSALSSFDQARERQSFLRRYQQDWPTEEYLKAHLHNKRAYCKRKGYNNPLEHDDSVPELDFEDDEDVDEEDGGNGGDGSGSEDEAGEANGSGSGDEDESGDESGDE